MDHDLHQELITNTEKNIADLKQQCETIRARLEVGSTEDPHDRRMLKVLLELIAEYQKDLATFKAQKPGYKK
jgi:hypothetical protein